MRLSGQRFWPVLTLLLGACSAFLDFDPAPKELDKSGTDRGDGGAPSADAAQDSAVVVDAGTVVPDTGTVMPEASVSCDLATHAGCDPTQLCCDRSDGNGARCFDTLGARECGACGQACTDPAAPHCGADRTCECEPGSGMPCPQGKRCLGTAANARCAECETDDDCSTSSVGKQCVFNQCVQCDRGALTTDASDDQGCNEAGKPICDERNACVACSSNPDNCPGDQVCNGTLGCFGCDVLTPLDTRNCGGTRPICRMTSSGQPQCEACRNDNECAPGYCDSRPGVGTGACVAACAPAASLGVNGCSAPTPFCKQIAGNEFACRGCTASDCSGATPYCATEAGPRRGYCVACRSNADCAQNAAAPVCDAASASCRARQASDCPAGSVFDPATMTCSECQTSAECADTPATPACVRNTCVQCETDGQCGGDRAPLCSAANRCVACNMAGQNADARCAAEDPDTLCVTQGDRAGQCAVCDPRPNNPPARGCPAERGFCLTNTNTNELDCHECDPGDMLQTCPNRTDCDDRAGGGIYRCVPRGRGS